MPAQPAATPSHPDTPRLVALSATYRLLPTGARESLAQRLGQRADRFREQVTVHTCHRVEVIGLLHPAVRPPSIDGGVLARGMDAAERVFVVAGGLDAAVLGEEQLLGQVRASYEAALASGRTGPILNELFRRAIRFGRGIRSRMQPGGDRSLADAAVRWLLDRLTRDPDGASGLVVGSGQMGLLVARGLAHAGMTVTVASRSLERAERVRRELAGADRHRSVLLDEALGQLDQHDVVAIAVRSASLPVDVQHLGGSHRPPLVVDLSAPSAVTPGAAAVLGERLLDLDGIGSLAPARSSGPDAEERMRQEARQAAADFIDWWESRARVDGVTLLRAHAAEIRARHLDRLRRRADLTPAQLAAVETATAAMIGELLHAPTRRIQREPGAGELVARLFGVEQ